MKTKLMLFVVALLCLTLPAAAQTVDSAAKPFHISSRGTGFGVQGEFEGTYRINDAAIEIDVRKATLYVSEHCPYQGARSINFIRLGLGYKLDDAGRWDIKPRSLPLNLSLTMRPAEEYTLYDLHFTLPLEKATDLAKHWLVVEIQTDALDAPDSKPGRGFVFAQSCPCIFTQACEPKTEAKR
jgi:hypothetical protein